MHAARNRTSQIGQLVLQIAVAVAMAWPVGAQSTCTRSDFELVVEEAATALRNLNLENKPKFQTKLGELRLKRGWSHDAFMEQAAPLVQDQQIADFDTRSSTLLDQIQSGGQAGSTGRTPDCALLQEIRATLKMLLAVQQDKWSYMMDKIDLELTR